MIDETKNETENSKIDNDSDCGDLDTSSASHSAVVTTTTKNALIRSQLGPCETYPHRLKVSVVGVGNVGMACAIAILMRKMASEICLVDKNKEKVEAEAEDIRHASIFLGNPLVIGTHDKYPKFQDYEGELIEREFKSLYPDGDTFLGKFSGIYVPRILRFIASDEKRKHLLEVVDDLSDIATSKESAVVIISVGDPAPGKGPNLQKNLQIFKKVIPAVAKWCPRAVIVVVTQPIEVMSYIAWKLSKFPPHRVLGTGTLIDSVRLQYYLGQKLGLANTSISCMNIGAQGDHSVPVWSNVNVAGMKLRDINPKMGEKDDPENWHEIGTMVNECGSTLDEQKGPKGPNCWGLGFCTAEIVDAILRNTKVVLPASTHIPSCTHGTDKDIYMSIPCVIGKEGVLQTVRQKLTDQEKTAVQFCADSIRTAIRESGILREDEPENGEVQQPEA